MLLLFCQARTTLYKWHNFFSSSSTTFVCISIKKNESHIPKISLFHNIIERWDTFFAWSKKKKWFKIILRRARKNLFERRFSFFMPCGYLTLMMVSYDAYLWWGLKMLHIHWISTRAIERMPKMSSFPSSLSYPGLLHPGRWRKLAIRCFKKDLLVLSLFSIVSPMLKIEWEASHKLQTHSLTFV